MYKFIRISRAFIVVIGLLCIINIWESHHGKLLNGNREFSVCMENMHGYTYSRPCDEKHFCNFIWHDGTKTTVGSLILVAGNTLVISRKK